MYFEFQDQEGKPALVEIGHLVSIVSHKKGSCLSFLDWANVQHDIITKEESARLIANYKKAAGVKNGSALDDSEGSPHMDS